MPASDTISAALSIAVPDLRWCYRERGIITGSRLVYWGWDSFFASLGACELGDVEIVKRNLELYLSYQREDGLLPKRVAHPFYWLKFLHIPLRETAQNQRPAFSNSYFTDTCITQNPTFVIALHAYVQTSGDRAFFKQRERQVEAAMAFLRGRQGRFGLLKEGIGGGWAESVLKRGALAFTNMCYARAAWCMAELYAAAGEPRREHFYRAEYSRLREAINGSLWSDEHGGFYSDWFTDKYRYHHFATDGNLLAILWDIATPRQAEAIQAKIQEYSLEDDVPIRTVYGPYPRRWIYPFLYLGNMSNYHVGFSWTWLGCVDVMVKAKMGQKKEALEILERISKVIERDGTVHEIYDKGKPVAKSTLFFYYKSEHPWAWGAGLFVAACASVGVKLDNR